MNTAFLTLLFVLSSAQSITDLALQSPRCTFTAAEHAQLVQILRERPANEWRTIDRPEIQRRRIEALHRALDGMRHPPGREPLGLVPGWWRVLGDVRAFPPQSALAGRLVSRPFAGYHVQVPRGYRADRPAPLVICLHSSGSRGGRACIERRWGRPDLQQDAIVFAPDWPHGEGEPRWSHRRYLHLTFGVLGDVILNDFNIDRNRVFVDGGAEAWRLAAGFAHLFAGLIVRGEAPPEQIDSGGVAGDQPFPFANLKNTDLLYVRSAGKSDPLQFFELQMWFEENTRRFTTVTLSDPAASAEDGERALDPAIAAFVARTRRNPYPRFIDWTVLERHVSRAYWVRSLDEAEPALEGNPTPPRFQVSRDRAANRIEIDAYRIRGLGISLNDAILDLSRPVTITVNGTIVFHGQPQRSLARALRSVARSGDWTDVYPWVTRVEVPVRQ